MKTRTLLVMAIFAASALCMNAQKLLISEEFNSPEWQAEFLRINPTYTTKVPAAVTAPTGSKSAAFSPLSSAELYFGKYNLSGAVEFIRSYTSQAINYVCALGNDYHNILVAPGDSVPVCFRFNNVNSSFFEFPEITSAGNMILHVRSGNNTKYTNIFLKEWDSETESWNQINAFKLDKRDVFWNTSVDEILTFDINSRTPIRVQLTGSDSLFCGMYQVEIEEHFSAGLKHSIDSATVIKNDNADNIGTVAGQYPQAAYDDFVTAIADATTVFDNTETTQTEVEDAELALNTAIADFEASMIDVGTGFNPANTTTLKQYGRKLVTSEATRISIFNVDGSLLYQQDNVKIMDVPASIRQGIYLVKSKSGVQKMYFGE
ncbi:MAG: hypothetical protein VB046_02495 [Paludibacter sp.]|jgi:hypothetical protein|nr:hypothetical protein [Paludibacter sp.]